MDCNLWTLDAHRTLHKNIFPPKLQQRASSLHKPTSSFATQETCGTEVSYHNGPLLTNGINLYSLWLSSSASEYSPTSFSVQLLDTFTKTIGGSTYLQGLARYRNTANTPVSTRVTPKFTLYYRTSALSINDAYIQNLIADAINVRGLALDVNAVYVIFFSGALRYTSFTGRGDYGRDWCAFHSALNFRRASDNAKVIIKYVVIGDASHVPPTNTNSSGGSSMSSTAFLDICAPVSSSSINGHAGADGLTNALAHELQEVATNPQFDGWYTDTGVCEIANLCSWTYGTISQQATQESGIRRVLS